MPRDQVFISYSHKDKKWRDDLDTQLKPYLRGGSIVSWSDQQIASGSEWLKEIQSALPNSKVAVLLVSPDFLASDFIHEHELGPLLKEANQGGVKILWVPVRDCAYKRTPLKDYQAVLDPGTPLAKMTKADRDSAWVAVCEEIEKAVNPLPEDSLKDAVPQSAPPVGQKPERPSTLEPPDIPIDISQIGQYAPANLIGRESETQTLSRSWNMAVRGDSDRPFVLIITGMGGAGKSSLVAKWAALLARQGWPGCASVLGWSFYSQGTREVAPVSADRFLKYALAFFGDAVMAGKSEKPAAKGRRLAELIGQRRALLILDGLEPLQYPPSVPMAGQLRDSGLAALLQSLAAANRGLCVVTTRISVQDLTTFLGTTVREDALTGLSTDAGAMLLRKLGVVGDDVPMQELVDEVQGHALTLTLLGSFLKRAYQGDIKKRDRVKLEKADSIVQGGHAFRTMEAYEQWLLQGGEEGKREVAILRLMGLFDRPADASSIKVLCSEIIPELNEPLVGQSEEDWSISLSKLEESHLLTVKRADSGEIMSVDAHPLLREYFAEKMLPEIRECAETLLSKGDRESGKVRAGSWDTLPMTTALAGQAIYPKEPQKVPGEPSSRGVGLLGRRRRSLSAFICYARESDTEFRSRLSEELLGRGIEPKGDWLLAPGPFYNDQLAALIRESDVFIAVISRLSVASPECHDEIDQANLQKKKILPVQVQDGFYKAALHEALRIPQWTLLRPIDNYKDGIKSLVEAINTDFDLLVVHTWLTQRATDWDTKDRPRSALLAGRDLKEAEIWLPKASANQLQLPNVTLL